MSIRLVHGDCREVLPTLEASSFDSIVTDPPAGIAFMGKDWDRFDGGKFPQYAKTAEQYAADNAGAPRYGNSAKPTKPRAGERAAFIGFLTPIMAECLRAAKPGAYALVWALPRTSHWTATAVEDAGWIIQDCITHLFGQGFPKHKSKLKPAAEFWWLAWKPAKKATPLQIDACRIACESGDRKDRRRAINGVPKFNGSKYAGDDYSLNMPAESLAHPQGRWPANVVLTCCGNDPHDEDCAAAMLDEQSGISKSSGGRIGNKDGGVIYGNGKGLAGEFEAGDPGFGDTGGASRFFYVAKASRSEREAGLETLPAQESPCFDERPSGDFAKRMKRKRPPVIRSNTHPTVKPLALMRWLVRLITPPGGTVLDPFAGSGATLLACHAEGFDGLGIERKSEYAAIAEKRLANSRNGVLFA